MACSRYAAMAVLHAFFVVYVSSTVITHPIHMPGVPSTCECHDRDISVGAVGAVTTAIMWLIITILSLDVMVYWHKHVHGHKPRRVVRVLSVVVFTTLCLCTAVAPLAWCMRCDDASGQTYLGLLWQRRFTYALYITGGAIVSGLIILVLAFVIFTCGVVLVMRGVYGDPHADSDFAPIVAWLDDKLGNKQCNKPPDKPPLSAVALSQLDELNMPTE
jgi:hypothetical protein